MAAWWRSRNPGLWVGLPWGIDRVDRVPVNFVQRLQVGFQPDAADNDFMPAGQMLTGDQNLINIQAAIDFTVGDGDAVVSYVTNRDRVEPAIARAAEAALAEWVAGHTVDDVLLTGKVALRAWLVERTQERIEPYRLGVRIQSASVVYLAAPDEVKPEFDRVMIAQAGIHTKENEARQDASRSVALPSLKPLRACSRPRATPRAAGASASPTPPRSSPGWSSIAGSRRPTPMCSPRSGGRRWASCSRR